MPQARKKRVSKKKRQRKASTGSKPLQGIGFLVVGVLVGVVGTLIVQGMTNNQAGLGSGIRELVKNSQESKNVVVIDERPELEETAQQQATTYDFYTVLPEIEVVVPRDEEPEIVPQAVSAAQKQESAAAQSTPAQTQPAKAQASYLLQVGSYRSVGDANRIKAELALQGLQAKVQKVTIEGRGDYFRVRLGPYGDLAASNETEQTLISNGIKPLLLKVAKG